MYTKPFDQKEILTKNTLFRRQSYTHQLLHIY